MIINSYSVSSMMAVNIPNFKNYHPFIIAKTDRHTPYRGRHTPYLGEYKYSFHSSYASLPHKR